MIDYLQLCYKYLLLQMFQIVINLITKMIIFLSWGGT